VTALALPYVGHTCRLANIPEQVSQIVNDASKIILTYGHGARANRWLTRAFHDPAMLKDSGVTPAIFDRFRIQPDGAEANECLLIGWKVKRLYLACLGIALSIAVTGVGVLVGVLSQSAVLGAGIASALVTLLGFVHGGFLNMVQKDRSCK
jgi:hypothetical protein